MRRIDKDANRAFYDSELPAERSRFQVDPSKLHTAGLLVPWVLAALNPGDRVLDVAGGAGSYASEIVRRADVSVVGIDISEAMVRQRREDNLLSVNAVADMEALPFEADTFDAAMVVAALHHVPDPIPALREILRVLRPGGTLLAYEPCSITARRVGRKGVPGMSHEFAVSRPWLLAQFHDAGFAIQKVRGANLVIRAVSPLTGPPSLRVYRAADAVDRFACLVPGLAGFGKVAMIRASKPGSGARVEAAATYACPRCKVPLETADGTLACPNCSSVCEIRDGIPLLVLD
jgi:SAM-dependent methyltransferase